MLHYEQVNLFWAESSCLFGLQPSPLRLKCLDSRNVGCLSITVEYLNLDPLQTIIPGLTKTLWRLFSFSNFYIFKKFEIGSPTGIHLQIVLRSVRIVDKTVYSFEWFTLHIFQETSNSWFKFKIWKLILEKDIDDETFKIHST